MLNNACPWGFSSDLNCMASARDQIDSLTLEQLDEALCKCIAMTISVPTHTAN